MKRNLPVLVVLGVGLLAVAVYWRQRSAPEVVHPPSTPMPRPQAPETPALVDGSAPQPAIVDEKAPPVAATTGGVRGRILSRDPMLSPPYHLTWTPVGESMASAMRCDGESFALSSLSPGEWRHEVRARTEDLDPPRSELLGGPSPERSSVVAQRTMLIEPGKTLELEVWVGREPLQSAHLLGFLEGPNVDLRREYSVHLVITEEDGGRFEARSTVDDAMGFDFGFVPPGQAGYVLRVADHADAAFEDLLASGSLLLVAGEQTVLPIEVPETTRIRFRVLDGGPVETRIHWASTGAQGHGGIVMYPHRSEISVPAGEYLAIAYQPGFAAELARIDAHGPLVEAMLRMAPAGPRPVQLVDPAGNPVPGASLRVVRIDETGLSSLLLLNTQTNDEGVFDASAFPAGRLEVEIYRRDGSMGRVVADRSSLGDRLVME